MSTLEVGRQYKKYRVDSGQTYTRRHTHTDRQTDRQTDTQTDRPTDRQTHRQTDTVSRQTVHVCTCVGIKEKLCRSDAMLLLFDRPLLFQGIDIVGHSL